MAKKPAAKKTQVTKRGDQAPEAKRSPKAQSAAAQEMFDAADAAGQPTLTEDQQLTQLRRSALGY